MKTPNGLDLLAYNVNGFWEAAWKQVSFPNTSPSPKQGQC